MVVRGGGEVAAGGKNENEDSREKNKKKGERKRERKGIKNGLKGLKFASFWVKNSKEILQPHGNKLISKVGNDLNAQYITLC